MAEGDEDSYTADVTSVKTNRRVRVDDIEASLFSEGEEGYPIACREELVGTSGCKLQKGLDENNGKGYIRKEKIPGQWKKSDEKRLIGSDRKN